jgi:hypothetical protein
MPKVKMLVFFTIISILVNLGVTITAMAISSQNNFDVGGLEDYNFDTTTSLGVAIIPFASIVAITTMGLPTELVAIMSIPILIFSILQTLLIVFIGLQLIGNLIYHPDI